MDRCPARMGQVSRDNRDKCPVNITTIRIPRRRRIGRKETLEEKPHLRCKKEEVAESSTPELSVEAEPTEKAQSTE